MAVEIIKPGILTTIQDAGRTGYRSSGIGTGGAMDLFAATVANYLTGNTATVPVLEMHFPAAELLFKEDAFIAITGADFNATAGAKRVPLWQPLPVYAGDLVRFNKLISGSRSYIAFAGGTRADIWLNSYSTNTAVRAGGFNGRQLLKHDLLELNSNHSVTAVKPFTSLSPAMLSCYSRPGIIRCVQGVEWHQLTPASKEIFAAREFSISAQSNRMGYRLTGDPLTRDNDHELVSSAVDNGTVQLLPNGQLIVLMADHQTTGGYPRIANVISADLPKLAQCAIHSKLQFEVVDIYTAEDALLSMYEQLEVIKSSCDQYYDAHRPQL